jgi:hypothetical protein
MTPTSFSSEDVGEHVHVYIPPGGASFVSIYTPRDMFGTDYYSLSVPYDHPDWLPHLLPYPIVPSKSGYVHFKSRIAPEVDVRPASYRWLIEAIEENKARNLRDTTIFEAHALELELSPYKWLFHDRQGTNYRLIKVTILRSAGD